MSAMVPNSSKVCPCCTTSSHVSQSMKVHVLVTRTNDPLLLFYDFQTILVLIVGVYIREPKIETCNFNFESTNKKWDCYE